MFELLFAWMLFCQKESEISGCDLKLKEKISEIVALSTNVGDFTELQGFLPIERPEPNLLKLKDKAQISYPLFEKNVWRVLRQSPVNKLVVQKINGFGEYEDVDTGHRLQKDIYVMDLRLAPDGDLLLTGYDVHLNVPSGRRLDGVTNGIDVFKIDRSSSEVRVIGDRIPIAGIDHKIYVNGGAESIKLCAVDTCYKVTYSGDQYKWAELQGGLEFVELEFLGESVIAAILKKPYQDHVLVYECDQYYGLNFIKGIIREDKIETEPFRLDEIPYGLTYKDGEIGYYLAQDSESVRNLLEYELSRMNNNGLIDIGVNNLEARIAWSQTYYLNGLMALIDMNESFDIGFEGMAKRVSLELEGVVRACESDYPYLFARRYSLDREPILFALHLGRIAALVGRGVELSLVDGQKCLSRIKNDLLSLERTVEKAYPDPDKPDNIKYGAGFPFWADGANVPYNFISGFLGGFLFLDSYYGYEYLLSQIMSGPFGQKPYPEVWNYWGGVGNDGWSSGEVSVNTPEYDGNQDAKAHITYRTMDAAAIVHCYYVDACDFEIDSELIDHFRGLTSKGALLPSINDVWLRYGQVVPLNNEENAVFVRTRSSTHHDFYSQVFALLSILDGFSDTHFNLERKRLE